MCIQEQGARRSKPVTCPLGRSARKIRNQYRPQAVTVDPAHTLASAALRMQEHTIGSLVVVEQGGLAGIITERDLVRAAGDGADPLQTRIGWGRRCCLFTARPASRTVTALAAGASQVV